MACVGKRVAVDKARGGTVEVGREVTVGGAVFVIVGAIAVCV
jgi:hypothetical protein